MSLSHSARVAALQDELRRLQLLRSGELLRPGLYDAGTAAAVRRFQWFAGHVPGAVGADGRYVARPLMPLRRDGIVGPDTQRLLDQFQDRGWAATGLLVQLNFAGFKRLKPNACFVALLGGHGLLGLCERGFVPVLRGIDELAADLDLHVFVNRLFVVEDGERDDAPPAPASFCAHRIGRAVALQLGPHAALESGVNPQPPFALMNAPQDSAAGAFREHLKRVLQCRYGGDFDPVDPTHFERQLLPAGGEDWQMHHFFDQLQLRQALRQGAAIPAAE